jgi:hypothetical protein
MAQTKKRPPGTAIRRPGQKPQAPADGHGHGPTPTAADPHTGTWTPDQPPLQSHALADLFPALADQDLAALAADIAAQGLREAVWLYDGRILDGRNRYRVCQARGISCPTRVYEGDDPLGFVVSMNLHWRHLTESQRSMVAATLANMRQGARTDMQPPAHVPEVSTAKAAETLNISERLVRHAKKVQAEARPEVIQAVETGRMAVSAAAKLAEQPEKVQRAVVQALETAAAKTVTAALARVQGTAPPPTGREGDWLDPLGPVQAALRQAIDGFDCYGGVAAVIDGWPAERRQAFDERVTYVDTQWQRFLRAYRDVPEGIRLAREEPPEA